MIVPNEIAPVDYNKLSNEFIFVLEDFILRVNYESKYFELETPDKLSYHENFDFIKSPAMEFEIIDFGLVEWIRLALKWSTTNSRVKDLFKPFSFEVEGILYEGSFNARTNELTLVIPGKTILCKRESITTNFPEIQFQEHGKLITIVTTYIIGKIESNREKFNHKTAPTLPIEFAPVQYVVGEIHYEMDYLAEFDMLLLRTPNREIYTNMLTIETDVPELAVLHQEMLIDVIRDVVYEKSPSF